jgi:hypothetical protein
MYDISYPGIVCWQKSLFEKLGYMVIAHKNREYEATESYKRCIEHLMKAIEENMKLDGTSADRLHDYESMHNNLKVLHHHAVKDFYVKANRNNTSKVSTEESVQTPDQEKSSNNNLIKSSPIQPATGGKRKPSKKLLKKPSKKLVKKTVKKSSKKKSSKK